MCARQAIAFETAIHETAPTTRQPSCELCFSENDAMRRNHMRPRTSRSGRRVDAQTLSMHHVWRDAADGPHEAPHIAHMPGGAAQAMALQYMERGAGRGRD